MTKADLVSRIAQEAGITRSQAEAALSSFVGAVSEALERQEKVTLVGFGTFCVSRREARAGRNPRTREPMSIPASAAPRFKPGKELRERVNG